MLSVKANIWLNDTMWVVSDLKCRLAEHYKPTYSLICLHELFFKHIFCNNPKAKEKNFHWLSVKGPLAMLTPGMAYKNTSSLQHFTVQERKLRGKKKHPGVQEVKQKPHI